MKYKLKIVIQELETIFVDCEDFENCMMIVSLASHRFSHFEWEISIILPVGITDISRGLYYGS